MTRRSSSGDPQLAFLVLGLWFILIGTLAWPGVALALYLGLFITGFTILIMIRHPRRPYASRDGRDGGTGGGGHPGDDADSDGGDFGGGGADDGWGDGEGDGGGDGGGGGGD